jgi:hypothetical protein
MNIAVTARVHEPMFLVSMFFSFAINALIIYKKYFFATTVNPKNFQVKQSSFLLGCIYIITRKTFGQMACPLMKWQFNQQALFFFLDAYKTL